MINPENELFVWGPIDGRPVYTSFFVVAMKQKPKYTYRWPEFLFYFSKTKMMLIADYAALRNVGKKSFMKWIMDDNNLKKLERDYKAARKNLKKLEKTINREHLKTLSENEFKKSFLKWNSLYLEFWIVGLVPELSNWGGEQILREKLSGIIKGNKKFLKAMETLSAPEDLSFYQKEELDMLNIIRYSKNAPLFNKLLESHSKKYFWIGNSYFEQKILDKSHFRKQLSHISSKAVSKKIRQIKSYHNKIKKQKKGFIKKYRFGRHIEKISKRLSHSIWWQDARKEQIFTSNHYVELFLNEISRRKKIRLLDLKFYSENELSDLVRYNKKVSQSTISHRKKKCLWHYAGKRLVFDVGDNISRIIKPFIEKNTENHDGILKGLVVSFGKGPVKGKARILLTPRNAHFLKKGEILVAPMTSPDYVTAMRKAAAIVTDEGGMTSHAAIVSRELGIPCVVGTKIATKALKNGMNVEVDADSGIVRILKDQM